MRKAACLRNFPSGSAPGSEAREDRHCALCTHFSSHARRLEFPSRQLTGQIKACFELLDGHAPNPGHSPQPSWTFSLSMSASLHFAVGSFVEARASDLDRKPIIVQRTKALEIIVLSCPGGCFFEYWFSSCGQCWCLAELKCFQSLGTGGQYCSGGRKILIRQICR